MTDPTAPVDAPADQPVTFEPTQVDAEAMLAQIRALQERVDQMASAAGIPSDPIGAAVKNLKDHMAARTNANPGLKDRLADLNKEISDMVDKPSVNDVDFVRSLFDEAPNFEGKDYCKALATDVYKLVKA